MASTSETGHAKNVANFQDLISFCTGYGASYNPTNPRLTLAELENLYTTSQSKLQAVANTKTSFDNATNERSNAFADLKPLATRIVNSLSISGSDPLAVDNAKSINKKLQGSSKRTTSDSDENSEETQSTNSISTSQQSYDRLIDHLANLIEVLVQNPLYSPNETELQTATLQTKLQDLQTKNTNLINAYTQYSNAMIDRNNTLYNPVTGLVQTSKEVKQYVKSVFGAKSPQYQQVSGLEFKVIKR